MPRRTLERNGTACLFLEIFADEGPRHRLAPYGGRFGGRGRFKPMIKRSCHITVVLSEHAE